MKKFNSNMFPIMPGSNPYAVEVQGKANEPICVAMVLDRAQHYLKMKLDATLEDIYDRLESNAPRIAIITGSPDHPAHVMDHQTALYAATSVWMRGGVPFVFGIPVMCDGTAQSTHGMCYSLVSRNWASAMVVNQMESHSYHSAFVIQGCDKTPFGVLNGLASLDISRRKRGELGVVASFAPAHVLRGGTYPEDLQQDLLALADRCSQQGETALGDDLRQTVAYILQCTTNQAYQGIFKRAIQAGVLSHKEHKDLEKRLAVNTCHPQGGICAFNGTGNSCRHVISAFGLVHPSLELLTEPPSYAQVDQSIQALMTVCSDEHYSVASLIKQNIENAIRIHSATGGSSNIMMHLVSAMIYAGNRFSIKEYNKIRTQSKIPDIFDYSLTEGRDIFAFAQQCCEGKISGMETVMYELLQQGVPMQQQALTMSGMTWKQRMQKGKRLQASNVKDNPIVLSTPRRDISGIDILSGNFFETAVVKISGMPDEQLDMFDEKISVVFYAENEEEATQALLDSKFLSKFLRESKLSMESMREIYRRNMGTLADDLLKIRKKEDLFDYIIEQRALRIALIIAGVGPKAFGMPEMFTPMQHINSNQTLKPIVTIISDGRYSGVSYGAAIGHVTPEAYDQGGILYLQTGDILKLQLRKRKVQLLDRESLEQRKIKAINKSWRDDRQTLGSKRLKRMQKNQALINPTNIMLDVTDASQGVVPQSVINAAK